MKLLGKLVAYPLMAANLGIAILLIFSSYGSLAAPMGKWPFASLSGLAFPFLFAANLLFLLLWLATWKKGALVPATTILICLGAALDFCPLHLPPRSGSTKPDLTVMTFNTQGFGIDDNNDWTTRNPVLRYILEQDPDIVFLQEATPHIIRNSATDRDIKRQYPYSALSDGETHLACLSKYPILRSQSIEFSASMNGCQRLVIQAGQDTIVAYNCHFQSNKLKNNELYESRKLIEHPTDSSHYKASRSVLKKLLESTSMRAGQARDIRDRVKGESFRHIIVCGDFNDSPLSYSHRIFDRFMYDAYSKTGLGIGHTYHEHHLYYRIDHIFCSRAMTPVHTWVDRGQKDSDHYPVLSQFSLGR